MENPLSLLQKYVVNKKEIVIRDNRVNFGVKYSWPSNVKTNFIIYGTGKNGIPKDYYTMDALLYFLNNLHRQHSIYVREAVSLNIQPIRRPDRRNLLAYLNGEVATIDSIDKYAQPEVVTTPEDKWVDAFLSNKRTAESESENEARRDVAKKKARLADVQKAKEQLAAKLISSKENCVTVDDLKSLSESMTVEKIAAIKTKRLAKKRTMIKFHDDLGHDVEMSTAFSTEDRTKEIFARERSIRNRINILQSANKEFATGVFKILRSIKIQEMVKLKGQPIPAVAAVAPQQLLNSRQQASIAYNRYDQQRFNKQQETTAGLTIQTIGTHFGQDIELLGTENNPIFKQPLPKSPDIIPKKRTSTIPIIIVPSSSLSLITTLNCTDILQDLRFVSNDEKRATAKKQSDVLIQRRKPGGLTVPYRIIENPLKLHPDDWQRVVAVFVVGPAWQFKGWSICGGNPTHIFSRISAFHLKYDDIPLDSNVARWAVKTIDISRTKRHLDKAALLQFWESLDKDMKKKRTHLRL